MTPVSRTAQDYQHLIDGVAAQLKVASLRYAGESFTPLADYAPFRGKIHIRDAVAARLTDFELSCIIAHELGHAQTKWLIVVLRICLVGLGLVGSIACLALGDYLAHGSLIGLGLAVALSILLCRKLNFEIDLLLEIVADRYAVNYAKHPDAYREVLLSAVRILGKELTPQLKRRIRWLGGL